MGTSTDGQICYGLLFEDGFEFPWSGHPWNGEADVWWRDVNGYKPPFEIFDASGEFIGRVKPEQDRIDEYYKHRRSWVKDNPLPFELVNYCSGDYPAYILAVPGTFYVAKRGYPRMIDPQSMDAPSTEALFAFCERHGVDTDDADLGWFLSSYWG